MKLNHISFCALLALACFFITVNESSAALAVKELTLGAATDNTDIKLTVPAQLWDCTICAANALDEGGPIDIKGLTSNNLVGILDDPNFDYPFGLVESILDYSAPETPPVEDPMSVFVDVTFIPDSGTVDLTTYRYRTYGPLPNGMVIVPPPNGKVINDKNGLSQWYHFMFDGKTGASCLLILSLSNSARYSFLISLNALIRPFVDAS